MNTRERERERDIRDLEDVCKMRDLKLLQICFASKMLPFREGMNSSLALLKLFCCHVSYDRASAISARCRSLGEKQGCFPPKIRCFACTLKTAVILNPPQTWCQRAASQMPPWFLRICSTAPQPKSLPPPVTGGVGGKATPPRCRELWGNNVGARSRRMVDDFFGKWLHKTADGKQPQALRQVPFGGNWGAPWLVFGTTWASSLPSAFAIRRADYRIQRHITRRLHQAQKFAEVPLGMTWSSSPWKELFS